MAQPMTGTSSLTTDVIPERQRFKYSPEVADALRTGRPVVALESTIISHGMPFPENFHTAKAVEQIVRDNGATPATIAILDGIVHVGLDDEALHRLAELGTKVHKTSRRDIAQVVAAKGHGATTVSGTMVVSQLAGISVFVTGGIGGVHRGGEMSLDVSADLTELGRTPVCVVCAGVKSLLDIPRTLEFLETQGVTVATLGSNEFPAFFTPHSGCKSPTTVGNPVDAAALVDANRRLQLQSGVVVAVPIPEHLAADAAVVENAITQALREADDQNIAGADITPFLLGRVNELTAGASLKANIALIKHNAEIGAQIAAAKTVDFLGRPAAMRKKDSNIGTIVQCAGGVGRNIAEAATRCGARVSFVTCLGRDHAGDAVMASLLEAGTDVSAIQRVQGTTASVVVLNNPDGDNFTAVNDTSIIDSITPAVLCDSLTSILPSASLMVLDANLSPQALAAAAQLGAARGVPVWFETTSTTKCVRIIEAQCLNLVSYVSPNLEEIAMMVGKLQKKSISVPRSLTSARPLAQSLLRAGLREAVIVHGGASGVMVVQKGGVHYMMPASPIQGKIVSTNGAGDSMTGGIAAALAQGMDLRDAVAVGLEAARLSLATFKSVSVDITPELVTHKPRARL